MLTRNVFLYRASVQAPAAMHRQIPLVLLSFIALSVGLAQPSTAALVEGSSWSYISYYDHSNGDARTLEQQKLDTGDLFATEASLSSNNYAKSFAGIGENNALTGKIAVGTNRSEFTKGQILKAYSGSSYRDVWQWGTGGCQSVDCPMVNFSVNLSQTGEFTRGAANFTVNYYLWTQFDLISFYFNINDEAETPYAYSAGFYSQNLGSGNTTPFSVDVTFKEISTNRWSFSYTATTDFVTNASFKEDLSLSGFAWPTNSTEYFDSFNSFSATLAVNDAGYKLTSNSGRQIGTTSGGDTGTVPEPHSLYLIGAGLLGLVCVRKRTV